MKPNIVVITNNCIDITQDVALVYLLSGALLVSQKVAEGDGEVHMFTAYPGKSEKICLVYI